MPMRATEWCVFYAVSSRNWALLLDPVGHTFGGLRCGHRQPVINEDLHFLADGLVEEGSILDCRFQREQYLLGRLVAILGNKFPNDRERPIREACGYDSTLAGAFTQVSSFLEG